MKEMSFLRNENPVNDSRLIQLKIQRFNEEKKRRMEKEMLESETIWSNKFPKDKRSMLPLVEIFTDGSADNYKKKSGGYATTLRYGEIQKTIVGQEKNTTSNRMEIKAVIEGLKALKKPCRVVVYSDSEYLCNSIEKGWAKRWKANNWVDNNSKNGKRKNWDLFDELLFLCEKRQIKFHWVPRNTMPLQTECDRLARLEAGII